MLQRQFPEVSQGNLEFKLILIAVTVTLNITENIAFKKNKLKYLEKHGSRDFKHEG